MVDGQDSGAVVARSESYVGVTLTHACNWVQSEWEGSAYLVRGCSLPAKGPTKRSLPGIKAREARRRQEGKRVGVGVGKVSRGDLARLVTPEGRRSASLTGPPQKVTGLRIGPAQLVLVGRHGLAHGWLCNLPFFNFIPFFSTVQFYSILWSMG